MLKSEKRKKKSPLSMKIERRREKEKFLRKGSRLAIDLSSYRDEKKRGDVEEEPRQENPRSLLTLSLSLAKEGWIYTKEKEKKNGIIVSAVETRPAGRESSKVSPRITRVYGVSVSRLGHACRVGVERGTRRHARVFSLSLASDPAPDFQEFNLSSSLHVTRSFILIIPPPYHRLYSFNLNRPLLGKSSISLKLNPT